MALRSTYLRPKILTDVVSGTPTSKTFQVTSAGSDDFVFTFSVLKASDGTAKHMKAVYSKTTGVLTISNGTDSLAANDIITIIGSFVK